MSDTTPIVPDAWELAGNRQATLHLGGQRWHLKAPTLGELRDISEAIERSTDSCVTLQYESDAALDEVRKRIEAGEAQPLDLALESKRLGRELNRYVEDSNWEVLALIFDRLCDRPPPDPMTAPGWLYTSASEQIAALVAHWRTSPPARGAAPRK